MKALLQRVKKLIGMEEAPRTRAAIRSRTQTSTPAKRQQVRQQMTKACFFCKKTNADFTQFYDDQQQAIVVCPLCLKYAERRAYQKGSCSVNVPSSFFKTICNLSKRTKVFITVRKTQF